MTGLLAHSSALDDDAWQELARLARTFPGTAAELAQIAAQVAGQEQLAANS